MRANRLTTVFAGILLSVLTGCGSDQYDPLQKETLNPTEAPPARAVPTTKVVGPSLPKRKAGEPGPLIQLMFRAGPYSLDLPTREDPQELMKSVIKPNGIKWKEGDFDLEISKSTITFNGQNYGTLNNGDVVKVWPTGKLTVNGADRKPVGESAAK